MAAALDATALDLKQIIEITRYALIVVTISVIIGNFTLDF